MPRLSRTKQDCIDSIIDCALAEIGKTCPENTILEIIKDLNIDVLQADFDSMGMPDVSGVIIRRENEKPIIFINENQSERRKVFTLAHELGHFLLGHKGKENYRLDRQDYSEKSEDETEANYFAASILMPRKRFVETYNLLKSERLTADYFGVSIAAVRARKTWIMSN